MSTLVNWEIKIIDSFGGYVKCAGWEEAWQARPSWDGFIMGLPQNRTISCDDGLVGPLQPHDSVIFLMN